jgi:serine protein kinase
MREIMSKMKNSNGNRGEELMASDSANDFLSELLGCEVKEDMTPWRGTLKTYLPMVLDNPQLNETAHARICRMIEEKGVSFEDEENKENPLYKFFTDDLFGIDHVLGKIMQFFRAAAAGSEVRKRILLLWGPTSSGKSEFAILLKKGLEAFSKSAAGKTFAIDGCPMFENPLNAVPAAQRRMLKERFNIVIEGDLCPRCAYRLANSEDLGGKWENMPVKRVFLSEMNRIGIGTFQPGDTKSQSQSELVGSVNFAKLEEYGVESHPLAYNFDGELNVANRGLMEFIELLKVDPKFRHILLTLTQEKRIKVERFPLIYADLVPIAHTNETEFVKFKAAKTEEALHDRTWLVKFPYNLTLDNEVRIYEKLIVDTPGFKDIHIAPHTLKTAAMFAILSRLSDPKDKGITLLQKMQLYNGEDVDGFSKENIKELQKESEREGLDGISPRYIINRLSACFAKHGVSAVTPISALRGIKEGLTSNAKLDKEEIDKLENLISDCIVEYNKIAVNEVQKAFFVNFEHEINNLLENYMDNVEAYLDDSKTENEWGDMVEPDENLMRSVEEKVGITNTGKESFREEVHRKMMRSKVDSGKYDYQNHPKLKEALQKQLFDERADVIRLTVSSRNPDPESIRKLNSVIDALIEHYGYNANSANELLRYVNNIMSKTANKG